MRRHIPKVSLFEHRKSCPFKANPDRPLDHKAPETLKAFRTERGKMLPGRITGVSSKHRRRVKQAIKRARHLALIPFADSNVVD